MNLSVVIPTLNESSVIESCLKHLLKQKYPPFEVIVVDNGSTDETLKIIKKMSKKFNAKKISFNVFVYPRGNQIEARNFGVRKSRGELIGFLDADSFPEEDWSANIEKYFEDSEVVGIGGLSKFRNKGVAFNLLYRASYYYFMILMGWFCLGGGNSAFRRSSFDSVGGYSGLRKLTKEEKLIYPEDDFFLSSKLKKLGKLKFAPDVNVTLLQRTRDKKSNKAVKNGNFLPTIHKVYSILLDHYKIKRFLKNKINSEPVA